MIDFSEIKFKCHWRDFYCPNQQQCGGCEHQPADEDKKNGRNEPVLIGWEPDYDGGLYPMCPSCGEMPYSLDRCLFCGQKFIKDERAEEWSKPPEVEHLCAMRDGEKLTYEKLFYHIPKRKSAGGGLPNKERYWASRRCGGHGASQHSRSVSQPRIQGFPAQIGSWCKKLKIDYIRIPNVYQPARELVHKAQDPCFLTAPPRGAVKISWNISA